MKRSGTILAICLMVFSLLLGGCQMQSTERIKLRDLEFTVQSEETIPVEVMKLIEEKKAEPFKFTFSDEENLYICIGYGRQSRGGYSIAVDALYLAEDAIYVETTLLGPAGSKESVGGDSYPYIVLKTEALEKTVVCE